jgi:hypothetical protein
MGSLPSLRTRPWVYASRTIRSDLLIQVQPRKISVVTVAGISKVERWLRMWSLTALATCTYSGYLSLVARGEKALARPHVGVLV